MKLNISTVLRLTLVASLFTVGSLATACGGDGAASADAGPTIDAGKPDATAPCAEATTHSDFTWINANIFQKSCAFSGCHKTGMPPEHNLNLSTDVAFSQVVDVASIQVSKKLIDSTSTDCTNSYLYDKISNQNLKPGTVYMPRAQPMLCQEKLDAVCRWIAAGAKND